MQFCVIAKFDWLIVSQKVQGFWKFGNLRLKVGYSPKTKGPFKKKPRRRGIAGKTKKEIQKKALLPQKKINFGSSKKALWK